MLGRNNPGYKIPPVSRGKHTGRWRIPSYFPAMRIRLKVPAARRKRWESLIAVNLLKKPLGAAADEVRCDPDRPCPMHCDGHCLESPRRGGITSMLLGWSPSIASSSLY